MPSHMYPDDQDGRERGGHKLLLAVLIVVVVLVGGAYVGGAIAFGEYFYLPGTTLDGEDVSLEKVSDVAAKKSASYDGFETHVTGNGIDLTIKAADIDLGCDGNMYAQSALEQINQWAWPYEITQSRELTVESDPTFDRDKLVALIEPFVTKGEEAATNAGGTGISYDAERGVFTLADGVISKHINIDAVVDRITEGIAERQDTIKLGVECLDVGDSLDKALSTANSYVAATPKLTLSGTEIDLLTPEKVASWIKIGEDLSVTLDENAITEWCKGELSAATDTAGTERTYTRPDGKTFTVSDDMVAVYGHSSYGWIIDGTETAKQIVAALKSGEATTIEMPTIQTAAKINPGGQDWGDRYIDVNLSEQHATFFDGDTVIWEADITSGMPGQGTGGETPTGVWVVDSVKSAATDGDINLKGPVDPATGQPEWDSHVDFWVGFVGNGGSRNGNLIGFHNAPWQYNPFGGDTYLYDGSHGCIRLSYESGEALYNVVQKGDVVVVHK